MQVLTRILALLAFGAFATLPVLMLRWEWRRAAKELRRLRRLSLAQYRQLKIVGTPASHGFDARSATVVQDSENFYRERSAIMNYSLTRYACNPQGEYFIFISNLEGKGYINRVTPEIARVVLKDRYRAPAP